MSFFFYVFENIVTELFFRRSVVMIETSGETNTSNQTNNNNTNQEGANGNGTGQQNNPGPSNSNETVPKITTSSASSSSDPDSIPKGLTVWREAVQRSNTSAQLAMCLYMLEASIAWDKSIMKAVRITPNATTSQLLLNRMLTKRARCIQKVISVGWMFAF